MKDTQMSTDNKLAENRIYMYRWGYPERYLILLSISVLISGKWVLYRTTKEEFINSKINLAPKLTNRLNSIIWQKNLYSDYRAASVGFKRKPEVLKSKSVLVLNDKV